jgi:hypothetical protein
MAMNATKVTLNVVGINKTGKVFKEIAGGMASIGKSAALFSAAAVSGVAVAFAATARSLGHLSDVAMQAGVSADELTKMSAAMDMLGIKKAAPEELALAFQQMARTVGLTGMGGFKSAISAISQLGTEQERAQAAMAVFTETGLQFMPLIEAAAKDGGKALEEVIAGMPAVTQSAADAGDAVADAMSVMARGAKNAWSNACGEISQLLDGKFSGGVREAALRANAYIEYFAQAGMRYCMAWGEAWSKTSGGIQQGFAVALENMLKLSANFVGAVFKSVVAPFKRGWEEILDSVINAWIRVTEGPDAAAEHMRVVIENSRSIAQEMAEPLKNFAKGLRAFKWLPDGMDVKLDDLKAELETKLAQAAKTAAAVGSAAVAYAGKDGAEDAADRIKKAVSQVKNEMLMGESYKAATMSIRADYGKNADKTVQAVNALTAVSEKIRAATEKTAAAMEGVGAV